MKKIIVFGISAMIASNILGSSAAGEYRIGPDNMPSLPKHTNEMTRPEMMPSGYDNTITKPIGRTVLDIKKISKDILDKIKFIDKNSYNGVKLRIQKFAKSNGIIPIALYNQEKKIEHYGFINNRDGGYILPTFDYIQFHKINYFEGGLEPVGKGGKYGYINIKGEQVIDFRFEDAGVFHSGLASVKKNGMWGYVDKKGNIIITPQFKEAAPFIAGANVAEVLTKDKKKALVNKQGDILLQCDWLMNLSEGNIYSEKKDCIYFSATKNNKSALVKVEKGRAKRLTDYIYTIIYYNDGEFGYEKQGQDYMPERGTLDLEGKETKEVYNPNGLKYGKVYNGRRIVIKNGLCGIADENKKIILSPKFASIQPFVNKNYTIVSTMDGKQGLINRDGDFILKPGSFHITPVKNKEDYVFVGIPGKVKLYDVKKQKYIGGQFVEIHPMNDDFIVVVNHRKSGLMNKNGEFIVEPYDDYSYEEHKKGYIVKSTKKGFCLTNLAGKKLSEEIYQSIQHIDENNYRVVMKNNRYGLADKDGKLLIPCIFELIKTIDKTKAQIILKDGDSITIGTVEIPSK
ncbi:WG repeat-containing protein [Clostridiaceae bacterium M8S5]|nr:WG repeat-containing protein [Clostridiaceae bacterium M8S5]